ncbi:MAG: DUF2959 family protein [Nitrospirales bacterium]|nr:DUF2959 family protein [Nitrospirales bacterium]
MIKREKHAIINMSTHLTAGMAFAFLLLGCSTPAAVPPGVAVGLEGLRSEAVSLRGQMEKTLVTLKDMMSQSQADLSPQYQSYTHELGILEAQVEKARQQRTATDTVVKDQFMAWDQNLKHMQNQESRQRVADRQAATKETYSDIQQKIAELKKVWTPFLTDLQDIRQYLKDDLSKEGLNTIQPTAERLFDQQEEVTDRLNGVIEAMDVAISKK